jgi:hypothetical protein
MKIFCNEGWKQVCYNRIAEDYSSFLHRVASLADDEFIRDLHITEMLIFPNKTEFYKHPLYTSGSIILQDKVSMKHSLKSFALFYSYFFQEKCITLRCLKSLHFCIFHDYKTEVSHTLFALMCNLFVEMSHDNDVPRIINSSDIVMLQH